MPEHGIRGVDLVQGLQAQQGCDGRRTRSQAASQDGLAQLRQSAPIGHAQVCERALDEVDLAAGLQIPGKRGVGEQGARRVVELDPGRLQLGQEVVRVASEVQLYPCALDEVSHRPDDHP